MEKIPVEWIDRIFEILGKYFNEKWSRQFPDVNRLNMGRTLWQNGLIGLDKDQIRFALHICKNLAANEQDPPNVLDFFHYAKGNKQPYYTPLKKKFVPRDRDFARNALDAMHKHLKGYVPERNVLRETQEAKA